MTPVSHGKPCAGNPHARFDEGASASEEPRRNALLHIAGKTVVYTSGTFDMLHINHLRPIEYARGLGDILIVGVNTDELVASYKSTPMIPFEDRIALMRAIKGPDLVIPQHSLDHTDKVAKLKFDILVLGDDWAGKYDYLESQGVTVVYTPYGRGTSSLSLKKKIASRYNKLRKKADTHVPVEADPRDKTHVCKHI